MYLPILFINHKSLDSLESDLRKQNVIFFIFPQDDSTKEDTHDETFANKLKQQKCFSKSIWDPLLTLVALFFFQNWSGFIATVFYGVDIFQV